MKQVDLSAGFAIIGGGLSGIAAAVSAARNGLRTILIHDRSIPLNCEAIALRLTVLATGSGKAERIFAWDVE